MNIFVEIVTVFIGKLRQLSAKEILILQISKFNSHRLHQNIFLRISC